MQFCDYHYYTNLKIDQWNCNIDNMVRINNGCSWKVVVVLNVDTTHKKIKQKRTKKVFLRAEGHIIPLLQHSLEIVWLQCPGYFRRFFWTTTTRATTKTAAAATLFTIKKCNQSCCVSVVCLGKKSWLILS